MRIPRAHHPAVLVALGDRHLGAERVPRLIEEPRQRDRVAAVEKPPLPHPDRLRRPGDQVRVVVLLALALADQVDQHAVCLAAAGDVRDHRLPPSAAAASRRARQPRGASPRAAARSDLPRDVRRAGELVDVVRHRREQPAGLEQLGHHLAPLCRRLHPRERRLHHQPRHRHPQLGSPGPEPIALLLGQLDLLVHATRLGLPPAPHAPRRARLRAGAHSARPPTPAQRPAPRAGPTRPAQRRRLWLSACQSTCLVL